MESGEERGKKARYGESSHWWGGRNGGTTASHSCAVTSWLEGRKSYKLVGSPGSPTMENQELTSGKGWIKSAKSFHPMFSAASTNKHCFAFTGEPSNWYWACLTQEKLVEIQSLMNSHCVLQITQKNHESYFPSNDYFKNTAYNTAVYKTRHWVFCLVPATGWPAA